MTQETMNFEDKIWINKEDTFYYFYNIKKKACYKSSEYNLINIC